MDSVDIFNRMNELMEVSPLALLMDESSERARQIAAHRSWLKSIRHELPSTAKAYNVGAYIRYFNQTKYEDYLSYHKSQFLDTMALCPNWNFVGFYIDQGSVAPNMESAPEWSRLIQDCFDGKVDLIITQKISNVSRKTHEVTFLARILAALEHPVGIYFISEDLFTLASYYQEDLKDTFFLPKNVTALGDERAEQRSLPKFTGKEEDLPDAMSTDDMIEWEDRRDRTSKTGGNC